MNLPHNEVYSRLQPSPLGGIGAFSIRLIPKGTQIFSSDESEIVWIDEKDVPLNDVAIREMYHDFCIRRNGKLGCPKNFNAMTPSWYLNHSATPNVTCNEHYDFIAARDINAGEELTVDYQTYSD